LSRIGTLRVKLLVTLVAVALPSAAANFLTSEQWREDLHFLARQVPDAHRDVFHAVSRADFEAAVAEVDRRIPTLADHEIVVELTRLVAMLGEGHTRISLPNQPEAMDPAGRESGAITPARDPRLAFHRLPVRLFWFTDGLFVTAATPEFRNLLGAQVLQIGDRPADAALQAIQPVISRDNDSAFRFVAPNFATIPEILSALRIAQSPSRVLFRLRTAGGVEVAQEFTPLDLNASPDWIDVFDARQVARPLYLRQPEKHYWFEYLEGQRTVYARVNAILDSPELGTAAFSRDLFAFIGSHTVDRLVFDLRQSPGGNNQLFRALLLGLVRETTINQPGKIFVLIDRGTFSAAVNAASDLEYLTNSIFIGEPTAGAPSSWGDSKRVTLPNSGLVARLSSVYWRDSTPDASRQAVTPDIPTPLSSVDYFAGRDPALEAANRFPQQSGLADILENVLKSGGGLGSLQRLYTQRKSDPAWAGESTKEALQRLGTFLISKKLYQGAFATFAANMREYPDSLGGAIQAAETAQAQDPDDKGVADLVRQLRALRGRQ
jgi:hypothetical protein